MHDRKETKNGTFSETKRAHTKIDLKNVLALFRLASCPTEIGIVILTKTLAKKGFRLRKSVSEIQSKISKVTLAFRVTAICQVLDTNNCSHGILVVDSYQPVSGKELPDAKM